MSASVPYTADRRVANRKRAARPGAALHRIRWTTARGGRGVEMNIGALRAGRLSDHREWARELNLHLVEAVGEAEWDSRLLPLHPAEAASVRMKEMTSGRKRMQQYVTVLLIGLLTLEASALTPREGPVRADGLRRRRRRVGRSMRSGRRCSGARGATSSIARASRRISPRCRAAGVDYVRVLGSVGHPVLGQYKHHRSWMGRLRHPSSPASRSRLRPVQGSGRSGPSLEGSARTPRPAARALPSSIGSSPCRADASTSCSRSKWRTKRGRTGFPDRRVPRSCAASAPGSRNGHRYSWRSALQPQERRVPHMQARVPTPSRSTTRADSAKKVRPRHSSVPGRFPARTTRNAGDSSRRSSSTTSRSAPRASVQQDDPASRIAAGYVMTFLAGNASYVLHAGPGIRGGGKADIERTASAPCQLRRTAVVQGDRSGAHGSKAISAGWSCELDPTRARFGGCAPSRVSQTVLRIIGHGVRRRRCWAWKRTPPFAPIARRLWNCATWRPAAF